MKKIAYGSLAFVVGLCLTACDNAEKTDAKSVNTQAEATVADEGVTNSTEYVSPLPDTAPVYKAAISAGYAPFEFLDDKGKIIGYDIDLIRAAGEAAGFKVEFTNMPFPQILPALQSREYDIGMSSGFKLDDEKLDDEKGQMFLQSDPYVQSQAGFWVEQSSPYQTPEDLNDKTISVQANTNLHQYITERPTMTAVPTDTSFLAFKGLLSGQADAMVEEESIMFYRADSHADTPVRFIPFTDFEPRQRVVVSASRNNDEVIANVNKGLSTLKANGKYQEINKKWFGEHAADIAVTDAAAVAQ